MSDGNCVYSLRFLWGMGKAGWLSVRALLATVRTCLQISSVSDESQYPLAGFHCEYDLFG